MKGKQSIDKYGKKHLIEHLVEAEEWDEILKLKTIRYLVKRQ